MSGKIINKLNNFKTTAIVVSIISALAAIYAIESMFLYHFAGNLDQTGLIRSVAFEGEPYGAYKGMILFLMIVAVAGISIFIVYSMFPFILNKEKLMPRKGLLVAGFIGSFFEIILVIFMVLIVMSKSTVNTRTLIIISLPLGGLTILGTLFYIIPFKYCDFYMPEIK